MLARLQVDGLQGDASYHFRVWPEWLGDGENRAFRLEERGGTEPAALGRATRQWDVGLKVACSGWSATRAASPRVHGS